jgi:hypothetical protein
VIRILLSLILLGCVREPHYPPRKCGQVTQIRDSVDFVIDLGDGDLRRTITERTDTVYIYKVYCIKL